MKVRLRVRMRVRVRVRVPSRVRVRVRVRVRLRVKVGPQGEGWDAMNVHLDVDLVERADGMKGEHVHLRRTPPTELQHLS